MPPPPDMGDDGDDRSALFAQINQGEDITKSMLLKEMIIFNIFNQI